MEFHTAVEWVKSYWMLGPFLPAAWKGVQWGWKLYHKWQEDSRSVELAKVQHEADRLLEELSDQTQARADAAERQAEDACRERDRAVSELASVRARLDMATEMLRTREEENADLSRKVFELGFRIGKVDELERENMKLKDQVETYKGLFEQAISKNTECK